MKALQKLYKKVKRLHANIFLKIMLFFMAIGIEIGIGTDTTNAIISSSIRPKDTKPSRVVT